MHYFEPVILFFLLGVIAGFIRSDLKIPGVLYESLSIFLLLAIGLKGGSSWRVIRCWRWRCQPSWWWRWAH